MRLNLHCQVSNRFNLTFSFPELFKGTGADKAPRTESDAAGLLRTVLPANATEASRIVMAKHRDRLQEAGGNVNPER